LASEHDAPVSVVTGGDLLLIWLQRAVALLGLLAILLAPWASSWKLGLMLAFCVAVLTFERAMRQRPDHLLELTRTGRCQLDGSPGELDHRAWLSSRYAVVRLRSAGHMRHLLISASKQADGEYRKLLAWMRLRPWDGGQQ
jgi:hypothetical protein